MKAWVIDKPAPVEKHPLKKTELALPEPGAGEVRIKINACGICHTDLHQAEGELEPHKLPVVPGHQVVGVVDKLGEGVKEFKVGDRVGVCWLYCACGECEFCQMGLENLCPEAKFTGYDYDGGYAEYMVSRADYTFHLPEDYDELKLAPLLCAGVIGWRSLKLSEAKKGEILGLFGFGASAHIVCQIARYLGIEVYAFSRSEAHQKLALKLGASWAGRAEESPPKKLDRAIIFAPAGAVLLSALRHLRPAGTVAINAVYMSPIPEMDYNQLLYGEKTIRSVSNLTREDAREFLELAPKVPIQAEIEVFEFDQAEQALFEVKQAKIQGAGVLKISS